MTIKKESYWYNTNVASFPPISKDIETDVTIVGGGITGITTAYLLAKENINVVLLEADQLISGTTGHTTAKITAQHGLIYDELIQHLGKDKAKDYYNAQNKALNHIKEIITEQQIACDFSEEDAYVYTNDEGYVNKVKKEGDAYQLLGIPGSIVTKMPLDIPMKIALKMDKQAQFHPIKYLAALIHELSNNTNIRIFEQSPAVDIKNSNSGEPTVVTKQGHVIESKHVVIASHFPFFDTNGLYFARMYAERSHLIAAKAKQKYPGGMYISAEQPIRSVRVTKSNDQEFWLFGGERYRTGHASKQKEAFQKLETFANQHVTIDTFINQWAAQDLTTTDKVPFIGKLCKSTPNIYVATGYRKWGMTNGTIAAQVMTDTILNKQNPFTDLFSPQRFHSDPDIKKLIAMNATTAKHLIGGKLAIPMNKVEELSEEQATTILAGMNKVGVYRDENKELHAVDTTCTHMGCEVKWNQNEQTWDCPCHGSRFSIVGEVLEGPATKPLEQYDTSELEDH
ncbi:Cytochrome b6-f complex iron-sulfur subunit [Paraliobacillus sp. PM-2]|uniref:FAD-dependent oxidoreductase n=1 Tax=Paraliobacillus sp. PM-2 TaxID=1462524 RepID=UPI00061B9AD1|nr:FAD-dependent oxidoreductase [Paraliobacillus sp. PM-2]CQR46628.1 Cytochrome b6-f complex iron-sulfur subunit [Paraliobacillus sp. PM-2]